MTVAKCNGVVTVAKLTIWIFTLAVINFYDRVDFFQCVDNKVLWFWHVLLGRSEISNNGEFHSLWSDMPEWET